MFHCEIGKIYQNHPQTPYYLELWHLHVLVLAPVRVVKKSRRTDSDLLLRPFMFIISFTQNDKLI